MADNILSASDNRVEYAFAYIGRSSCPFTVSRCLRFHMACALTDIVANINVMKNSAGFLDFVNLCFFMCRFLEYFVAISAKLNNMILPALGISITGKREILVCS